MGKGIARVLLAVGVVLLALAAILPGRLPTENTALAGGRWVLPDDFRPTRCAVTQELNPAPPRVTRWNEFRCELSPIRSPQDQSLRSGIRLWHAGINRLVAREGDPSPILVNVVPSWCAWITAIGAFLVLLLLPAALFPSNAVDVSGRPVSAWYSLLSEPGGGFSLARVQLLVWFVPAICMYAALSIPLHQFASLPAHIAVLLGLSGATTLLGAAANPRPAPSTGPAPTKPGGSVAPFPPSPDGSAAPSIASKAEVPRPNLADLVRDWQDQGDLSRYQYLLLALIGAVILVVRFFDDFSWPDLPKEFLALVGASQATYLGTKAVKTSRSDVETGGAAGGA